jgi:predicted nucleotidyltransferase
VISQQTIDQVKEKLIKEFNPVEIYLFGSYAWGHPDDESDLDIFLVVDKADEDRYKMLVRGHDVLGDLDIAKDLIIYTKDEFDRLSSDITRLSYKIKREGKLVYAKA